MKRSSNREFGMVMAAALGLIWLLRIRSFAQPALLLVAAAFLVAALLIPRALTPLNFLWTLLGVFLHRFVSPVVLGVLYFGVFTPFGWLFRLLKGDPLRLRAGQSSYWIPRKPEDQPGKGMVNQH